MPINKKSYKIGKIKQLIDLNEDSTNFNLSFKVTCNDETPFQVLVVDQKTLDETPELEYKEVVSTISGNIVEDKNNPQNHFLVLRSETPCVVDVEIDKRELPINNIITPNKQNFVNKQPSPIQKPYKSSDSSMNWTKIILIGVVVIVGLILLYYFYSRKNTNSKKNVDKSHEDFTPLDDNLKNYQNKPFKYSPEHHQSYNSNTNYEQNSGFFNTYKLNQDYSPSGDTSRHSSNRSNDRDMSLVERLKKISSK